VRGRFETGKALGERMNRPKKLGPDAEQRVAALYGEGLTVVVIGKRFGVAASTIRRILDQLKIERRPLGFANRIYK
jgi:Helix-turn-helix domain of resolvase